MIDKGYLAVDKRKDAHRKIRNFIVATDKELEVWQAGHRFPRRPGGTKVTLGFTAPVRTGWIVIVDAPPSRFYGRRA
jgi:hypothetical protein